MGLVQLSLLLLFVCWCRVQRQSCRMVASRLSWLIFLTRPWT